MKKHNKYPPLEGAGGGEIYKCETPRILPPTPSRGGETTKNFQFSIFNSQLINKQLINKQISK